MIEGRTRKRVLVLLASLVILVTIMVAAHFWSSHLPETSVEQYRKHLVMELVRNKAGTSEGSAHVLPANYDLRLWRVDGKGNIYVTFDNRCEVRKYGRDGKHLRSYKLQHPVCTPEGSARTSWILTVADDGHFLVFPEYGGEHRQRGLYVDPSGGIEPVSLAIELKAYGRCALVNGCVVHEHQGIVGRTSKAGSVSLKEVGRRRWGYGRWEQKQRDALQKKATVKLRGSAGSCKVHPQDVSPYKIRDYKVVGLDAEMNAYVGFEAEDPDTVIWRSMAEGEGPGSRYWIGKYDRVGKLLAWIECEPSPVRLSAQVTPDGTVFQYWSPSKANWSAFTRWECAGSVGIPPSPKESEARGARLPRKYSQMVKASPGFDVFRRIGAKSRDNVAVLQEALAQETDPELRPLWIYMLSIWSEKEESIKWSNQLLKEYPKALFPSTHYEMFLPLAPSSYGIAAGRPMKPMALARIFNYERTPCLRDGAKKSPRNASECIVRLKEIIDSCGDSDTYSGTIPLKLEMYMHMLGVCRQTGDAECACENAMAAAKFPNNQAVIDFTYRSGCKTLPESLMTQLAYCGFSADRKARIAQTIFLEHGKESWGFDGGGGDKYWLAAVGWLDSSDVGPDRKEALLREFLKASGNDPTRSYFLNVALGNVAADRGKKREAERHYGAAHSLYKNGKIRKPFSAPDHYYEPAMYLSTGRWEMDGRPLARASLRYLWRRFRSE